MGMFVPSTPTGYQEVIPGVRLKTLTHGALTHLTQFHLRKGSGLPRHAHPHEQTGYLVSGAMRLIIGEETFSVSPGDSWCIPGGVEHQALIDEDSVAIEVFSPVRDDYLALRESKSTGS